MQGAPVSCNMLEYVPEKSWGSLQGYEGPTVAVLEIMACLFLLMPVLIWYSFAFLSRNATEEERDQLLIANARLKAQASHGSK